LIKSGRGSVDKDEERGSGGASDVDFAVCAAHGHRRVREVLGDDQPPPVHLLDVVEWGGLDAFDLRARGDRELGANREAADVGRGAVLGREVEGDGERARFAGA
jgi:hypothetical protein